MDENGLPLTGAGVNYAAVEAINQRELITYINMFLVRTCSFLNNFSTKCETKLAQLHTRLESIDTSLTLLETKLNSVEELKNIKLESNSSVPPTSDSTTAQAQAQAQTQNTTTSSSAPPPPPPPPPGATPPTAGVDPSIQAQVQVPPPPAEPVNPISQDPRYSKYFKMIKLGVAEEAVRLKMKAEGVDPSFLERPNDPAPPPDESDSNDDDSD